MPKVYQIRTQKNNLTKVIDVVELESFGYGDPQRNNMTVEPILLEDFSYILMSFDSTQLDTITGIRATRNRCGRLEEISYYWNGDYSTESSLQVEL